MDTGSAHTKGHPIKDNLLGIQGDTWTNWFVPVLAFIERHDVGLWSYINVDWDALPMYEYGGAHIWGDTRIEAFPGVKDHWVGEVLKSARFNVSIGTSALNALCHSPSSSSTRLKHNDGSNTNTNNDNTSTNTTDDSAGHHTAPDSAVPAPSPMLILAWLLAAGVSIVGMQWWCSNDNALTPSFAWHRWWHDAMSFFSWMRGHHRGSFGRPPYTSIGEEYQTIDD